MKLGDLAGQFELECRGDADIEIRGLANLQDAESDQLTFLFNSKYKDSLSSCKAAAVVVREQDSVGLDKPHLISANPRMSWARIAVLFDTTPLSMPFIDPTAIISDQAKLGAGVSVGAHSVIQAGVELADGAAVGPNCFVGGASVIGAGTRLHHNVTVYHDVQLGAGCILHAGAVLGADGFGFEFDGDTGDFIKIPQIYGVRIGNDVEVGAGTTIDRGALNHTILGDGCKLDNQVQIGHGTRIDHHTVISGCTAIAGSTRIGSYCLIGGAVGIIDNIEIADQVEITAMSLVSQSILAKGRYSSGTGLMPGFEWKRSVIGFRKLDDTMKRVTRLEKAAQSSATQQHDK